MKFKYNKITKFIFKKCWVHQKINNLNDQNILGYYLAGLIKGDGSIIVPKKERNEKSKLLFPKVKITFVEKDSPLAIKIQEIIGAGTLEYPKNTKYVNLLFQDLNSIKIFFISLFFTIVFKIKDIEFMTTIHLLLDINLCSVVPIVCYNNVEIKKETILNENKTKAGIYCWTNIKSNKTYVGSSINL